MSLINDALKRAREAQQKAPEPASPEPQLRPVEPEVPVHRNAGLWLPAGLVLVALAGLLLAWEMSRKHARTEVQQVAAKSPTEPAVDGPSNPAGGPSATATPVETPKPETAAPPPALATTASAVVSPPADAPPPPPPLKLQGIVFHPKRPSVLIDGKTFFLGDRLGDLQLVAITRNTATLAGGGVTNVLTLSE